MSAMIRQGLRVAFQYVFNYGILSIDDPDQFVGQDPLAEITAVRYPAHSKKVQENIAHEAAEYLHSWEQQYQAGQLRLDLVIEPGMYPPVEPDDYYDIKRPE
jgi:hypothetical protein